MSTEIKSTVAPVKPVVKVKIITGSAEIMKSINSISTRGKALDTLIHDTACSILAHIHEHREVSLLNKLLTALPNSARKNALRDWFNAYGECEYDQSTKAFTFLKNAETYQEEAEQTPFWEFKPEPAYTPFDADKALKDLIKKIAAHTAKQNELDCLTISESTLAEAQAVLSAHVAKETTEATA